MGHGIFTGPSRELSILFETFGDNLHAALI